MTRRHRLGLLAGLLALTLPAQAADQAAIAKGVAYLRSRAGSAPLGEAALIALALVKAESPPAEPPRLDPTINTCLSRVRRGISSSQFQGEKTGGHDIYEASVVILALANVDPVAFKAEIATAAQYLVSKQKANGSWDYDHRSAGDTSISQYAVLGLWEAENSGVGVTPRVWDRAAGWFLSTQRPSGSWIYHPDESHPETVSMAAAGVGSLLICQRQLALHRRSSDTSRLLKPLGGESESSKAYEAVNNPGRITAGVKRGLAWLGSNFNTASAALMGQSNYYGLYGVERLGALADRDTLGRSSWFDEGVRYIVGSQKADGSWNAQHGDVPNTAWAILFLTKSTAKSIKKFDIKRLGAGTLLGGRGLPKDLSSFQIAQGRVVIRPMNGAVEGMLDVLADPHVEDADAALAGMVAQYHAEGPKVLRPHKERLRKLLTNRDPGVRRVAAWALGRSADLDVVPALIAALTDSDEGVVGEARTGLQVVSRKIDGYGPPMVSTPEQRAESAAKWKAWYDSVVPPDLGGARRPSP